MLEAVWDPSSYQLIDCGDGRKLERFGNYVVDRPAPAASWPKAAPELWAQADAVFVRENPQRGKWLFRQHPPADWSIVWDGIRFSLKCTPAGQVGIFPEQAAIWRWMGAAIGSGAGSLRVLHLFAYTGGATLAAAKCGAEVFHVDAARNVIEWARKNAELSGLAGAKIHWICEDAQLFVKREVRRGKLYDGIIVDPPTYGHGPRGQPWHIEKDLPQLLQGCAKLVGSCFRFLVVTAHAAGYTARRLLMQTQAAFGQLAGGEFSCGHLGIPAASGNKLPAGMFVLWSRGETVDATSGEHD